MFIKSVAHVLKSPNYFTGLKRKSFPQVVRNELQAKHIFIMTAGMVLLSRNGHVLHVIRFPVVSSRFKYSLNSVKSLSSMGEILVQVIYRVVELVIIRLVQEQVSIIQYYGLGVFFRMVPF